MNKHKYMRAAAFLLAVFFFPGLFPPAAAPAPSQTRTEAVGIPLKTTVVNDFAVPPPPADPDLKPGFKEKSFPLHEAENFKEMLTLTGPLPPDQIKLLEKNRFLLLPDARGEKTPDFEGYDEMLFRFDQLGGSFQEQKREPHNARFVGPDIFLHAFQVYLNLRLEAAETTRLRPVMRFMLEELLANAQTMKRETSGPSREKWERLTAQMAVPLVLISNAEGEGADTAANARAVFKNYRAGFSDSLSKKIMAELDRVYQAEARAAGLLGLVPADGGEVIDYTRFIPRGRHRHTAAGRAYFRAMAWLSGLGWDLSDPEGLADALNCALALSYDSGRAADGRTEPAPAGGAPEPAIKKAADGPAPPAATSNPADAWQAWAMITEINNFFLGYQSAPGFQQWLPFLMKEAGVDRFTADTAADEGVLSRLARASASLPKIAPVPHESQPLGPGQILCFFPARDSLTKILSAELTYQPKIREEAPAVFSSLYLPALLGGKYARELTPRQVALDLNGGGPERADSAEANRDKAQRSTAALIGLMDSWAVKLNELPDQRRFNSLDAAWLHLSATLTRDYGPGYPLYMQNAAYQAKQLETVLGSNTERQADLIFERPAAAPPPAGEGPADEAGDGPAAPVVKGLVEPNRAFWQEMIRVVKYTADGFEKHGLFPEDLEEYGISRQGALNRFLKRLERCAALSEKELSGKPLTDDDYEFIRLFTLDFMAAPVGGGRHPSRRTALATDIWTVDADLAREGQPAMVYEANAEPRLMLVLVGNDKSPRLTVGLAYNHYEIIAPYGLRLTNERWRKLVYVGHDDPAAAKKSKLPPKNFWYDPLRPEGILKN